MQPPLSFDKPTSLHLLRFPEDLEPVYAEGQPQNWLAPNIKWWYD